MASCASRTLEGTVRLALKSFPATLVTGPRQPGKTALLRWLFSRTHRYVPLENPDRRARCLADPIAFLEATTPPVILDEVQHTPKLLHYVKDSIDTVLPGHVSSLNKRKELAGQPKSRGVLISAAKEAGVLPGNNVVPGLA